MYAGFSPASFFLSSNEPNFLIPLCMTFVWMYSGNFRGQGIGELLLLDALKRAFGNTREVASAVVVIDAKDERARGFYLRHDFMPLPMQPNRLFYPMRTIEKLFPRVPERTKESRR